MAMQNRFGFQDLGPGIGLRTAHFGTILAERPPMGFFEILTENFLDTGGRPMHVLEQIAEHYPIVMHGVSLSIGSSDPLDLGYLHKLRTLAKRCGARWVSDHVCWTGVLGRNTHDLLPLPYTEETLRHCTARVKQVQEILERPLVLENPSTYLEFAGSQMPEQEFILRLAEDADCGLLLDVNNVFVSAFNHRFDPEQYIAAIPAERVVQYHLAGHTNHGTHILDTHDDHVVDAVWELFGLTQRLIGKRATLLEWDANIPSFEVVAAEAEKAQQWRGEEVRDVA
jgi:uncharacterized protein (UPF0276 family)